jgi:hypothetical protein
MDKPDNASQGLDVFITPNAEITWRDSSVAGHSCRFDDDQGDSTRRPASQMDQMPIIGESFLGNVLTHR